MFGIAVPGGIEGMCVDIDASGADKPAKIAEIERRYGLINDETRRLRGS